MTLQSEIDQIDKLSDEDVLKLLCDLCILLDAPAVVYVYDHIKSRGISITEREKQALKKIEGDRGKAGTCVTVPVAEGKRLGASRRIHKIMKGFRVSKRHVEAADHIEAATIWVKSHNVDARSSGKARIQVAKQIAKDLSISFETARGVVTTLKRKGVL